jgi:hypothetical protein
MTPLPADWHQWPAWLEHNDPYGIIPVAAGVLAGVVIFVLIVRTAAFIGRRHDSQTDQTLAQWRETTRAYAANEEPRALFLTETKTTTTTKEPEPMPLDSAASESGDIDVLRDRLAWLARRVEVCTYSNQPEEPEGDAMDRLCFATGVVLSRLKSLEFQVEQLQAKLDHLANPEGPATEGPRDDQENDPDA